MPLDEQGIYFPEHDPYRDAYLSLPELYSDAAGPAQPLPELGPNATEGDRALYARIQQLYNAKRDYPGQIAAQGLDYTVDPAGYDQAGEGGYGNYSQLLNDIAYGPLHPGAVQYDDPNIQNFVAGTLANAQRTDSFSFLGDNLFPVLALLGTAVGGAALAGGFAPAAAGAGAVEAGTAAGLGNVYGVELGAGGALAAGGGATSAGGLIVPASAAGTAGAVGTGAGVAAGGAGAAGTGTAAGTTAAGTAAGGAGTLSTLADIAKIAGPAISGVTGVIGAVNSGNAAKDAAEIQANAARESNQLLRDIYTQNRADLGPYRELGYSSLGQLQQLAGQAQPTLQQNAAYNPAANQFYAPVNPIDASAYGFTSPVNYPNAQAYAFTGQPALNAQGYNFQAPTLTDDPGYNFRLEQGRKALEKNLAAQGKYLSGAALKELTDYGQGAASQEYAAAYQRALGENQLRYGRDYTQNQDTYNRELTANQLGYSRDVETNQIAYNRALQENQQWYNRDLASNNQAYQRALTENQLGYERGHTMTQEEYQRQLDAYNAAVANQGRQFGQIGTLAQIGLGAATNTANLGQQFGAATSENLLGAANANAAGQIGAANAFNQGLSSVGNAAQQYLDYLLLSNR